ncbi:MAG TPA: FGGY family carbohydrate kinase, partial [Puia sp.]|nr:FGGY family carbohydrate kinase [Puia sp.]
MTSIPAIAIFDVGKTNKKILLFDEQYNLVHKEEVQLEETADEDGFPCENIQLLTQWMEQSLQIILSDPRFQIRAVNFTAYGASLVHLDLTYKPFIPLYNYLKPYPSGLQEQFYHMYGGLPLVSRQTASPVLGSLNSGMQLYRLKYEKPDIYNRIVCSLHLPQYLSFIISGKLVSDMTSIGCHTNLWHFENNDYHPWVENENITPKLAQIHGSDHPIGTTRVKMNNVPIGIGLHDSSSALIPYLKVCAEPFILISTGTWCICMNPFNHTPLTKEELEQDCLFYIGYKGKYVKASRLFAGSEH